jgi:hypothetical protein
MISSCPLGEVGVAGLPAPVTGSCRTAASGPPEPGGGGEFGMGGGERATPFRLARAGPVGQVVRVVVVVSRGHGEQPAAVRIRLLGAAGAPGRALAWASCGTVPSVPRSCGRPVKIVSVTSRF